MTAAWQSCSERTVRLRIGGARIAGARAPAGAVPEIPTVPPSAPARGATWIETQADAPARHQRRALSSSHCPRRTSTRPRSKTFPSWAAHRTTLPPDWDVSTRADGRAADLDAAACAARSRVRSSHVDQHIANPAGAPHEGHSPGYRVLGGSRPCCAGANQQTPTVRAHAFDGTGRTAAVSIRRRVSCDLPLRFLTCARHGRHLLKDWDVSPAFRCPRARRSGLRSVRDRRIFRKC